MSEERMLCGASCHFCGSRITAQRLGIAGLFAVICFPCIDACQAEASKQMQKAEPPAAEPSP